MPIYCPPSIASVRGFDMLMSFGLVTETLRARWLAGTTFKCGYQGPQMLTECQILRNYWCTQPATAPDTSQTESLNVTDKWIFMKLGERKEEQDERTQNEKQNKKKRKKKITFKALPWKYVASHCWSALQRMWDQAFLTHSVLPNTRSPLIISLCI